MICWFQSSRRTLSLDDFGKLESWNRYSMLHRIATNKDYINNAKQNLGTTQGFGKPSRSRIEIDAVHTHRREGKHEIFVESSNIDMENPPFDWSTPRTCAVIAGIAQWKRMEHTPFLSW